MTQPRHSLADNMLFVVVVLSMAMIPLMAKGKSVLPECIMEDNVDSASECQDIA